MSKTSCTMAAQHILSILCLFLSGCIVCDARICTFTDIMNSKGLDHTLMQPLKKGHNLEACKKQCLADEECWSTSFSDGYCLKYMGVECEFQRRGILSRKSCDVHHEDMEKIINHEEHHHEESADHEHGKGGGHVAKIDRPMKYASQCDGIHASIHLSCDKHKDGGDKIHIVRANYGRNDTSGKTCNALWESTCRGQGHHHGGAAHVCEPYTRTCFLDALVVFEHDCEAMHKCTLRQVPATFHNGTAPPAWCQDAALYSEVWYQCSDHVVLDHAAHKRKCWKH